MKKSGPILRPTGFGKFLVSMVLLLWQTISRKAATRMNFIDKDSFFYTWILVHYPFYFIDISIKNSNTRYTTSVSDRTNNR